MELTEREMGLTKREFELNRTRHILGFGQYHYAFTDEGLLVRGERFFLRIDTDAIVLLEAKSHPSSLDENVNHWRISAHCKDSRGTWSLLFDDELEAKQFYTYLEHEVVLRLGLAKKSRKEEVVETGEPVNGNN